MDRTFWWIVGCWRISSAAPRQGRRIVWKSAPASGPDPCPPGARLRASPRRGLDERLRPHLEGLASREPRLSLPPGRRPAHGLRGPSPPLKGGREHPTTSALVWSLLRLGAQGLQYHAWSRRRRRTALRRQRLKERYPLGVTLEVMGAVEQVPPGPSLLFRPRPVDSAVIGSCSPELSPDGGGLWAACSTGLSPRGGRQLFNNLKG